MRWLLIPAFNPGPYTGLGNNTYLIAGREPALIDAGVGDPRHLDAIQAALEGSRLATVIVTHAHSDHVSGVGAIAARWPQVRFCKMPWPERDAGHPVRWETLEDDELVSAGDAGLRVVHTPGHAPDHICLLAVATGDLFAGDLVVSGGSVVIPATRGGDLAAYLSALERVRALGPHRLLPAHGPVIENPAAILDHALQHRRMRERQILGALAGKPVAVREIVDRVYQGLAPALADAAGESVLAHLIKLERERRVVREGDRWRTLATSRALVEE